MDPLVLMNDVEQATERLLNDISDMSLSKPSGLPGWTVEHVIVHLTEGADAMAGLLTWARTGAEPPAQRSPGLREASERFADAAAALPAEAWTTVLPSTGQPAAALPWARLREIEVHHVDLGLGYTPADWSDAFALRLLREIVTDAGPDAQPLILQPLGVDHRITLGDTGDTTPVVSGPTRTLAAWLAGRDDGSELTVSPDGILPVPTPWK